MVNEWEHCYAQYLLLSPDEQEEIRVMIDSLEWEEMKPVGKVVYEVCYNLG